MEMPCPYGGTKGFKKANISIGIALYYLKQPVASLRKSEGKRCECGKSQGSMVNIYGINKLYRRNECAPAPMASMEIKSGI
jgi:hypothetical protein